MAVSISWRGGKEGRECLVDISMSRGKGVGEGREGVRGGRGGGGGMVEEDILIPGRFASDDDARETSE